MSLLMDFNKALAGIAKQREAIHKQDMWSDPVLLSEVMTKLAVYNSYLADNIAVLHKVDSDAKFSKFREHEDKGATKAEAYAKGETTEQRSNYENVKFVYSATSDLLSQLQSRLRVLSEQRRQEGNN